MPRGFSRTRRVEEQLRRDLAELIRQTVKEPGLGLLSVAEIKVSADLAHARVYISLLEDDTDVIDFTLQTLKNHAGKLRGLIGRRMHIRTVPQLEFIYDDLIQRGAQLDHLIDQAVHADREKADEFGTDLDAAVTDDSSNNSSSDDSSNKETG